MLIGLLVGGCNDVRDFEGGWVGPRVGSDPVLVVGALGMDPVELAIDSIDRFGLRGRLRVGALLTSPLESVPGAEADVLASLTFDGAPLRTYLAFVAVPGGDHALAVVSLYDDARVELRMLRAGDAPLYAIYVLRRGATPGLDGASYPSPPPSSP